MFRQPDRFVYFIKPTAERGPIKIGCSVHEQERLKVHLIWSPVPLEIICAVPGSFDLERRLHGAFLADHVHGEWFKWSEGLQDVISAALRGEDLNALVPDTLMRRLPHRKHTSPEAKIRVSLATKLRWARNNSNEPFVAPHYAKWDSLDWRARANVPLPDEVKAEIQAFYDRAKQNQYRRGAAE